MIIFLFHLSPVINKILIIGPFFTRVLLSKTRTRQSILGSNFANKSYQNKPHKDEK